MDKRQQYECAFNYFNEDKDGKISLTKLQRYFMSTGGEMLFDDVEKVVVSIDSDSDELLCLKDFVRLMEGAADEEKAHDLKEAFKMYEMEVYGCITPRILKRMLCRLGESKSMDECKMMISPFDLNGGRVLNFEEFKVTMCC